MALLIALIISQAKRMRFSWLPPYSSVRLFAERLKTDQLNTRYLHVFQRHRNQPQSR